MRTDADSLLDRLAHRSGRLAQLVEGLSRRRDVRALRSAMLLELLSRRCPVQGRPGREWYVRGAVARLGASGLRRVLEAKYSIDVSLRRIRDHLRALELAGCLFSSPGDRIPTRGRTHARYSDTIHILEDDVAAEWWARVGAKKMRKCPSLRTCARAFKRALGSWRESVRVRQAGLFDSIGEALEPARRLLSAPSVRAAAREREPRLVLRALDAAGVGIGKPVWAEVLRGNELRVAAHELAGELERGRPVRNPAGWIVSKIRNLRQVHA